MPCVSRGSDFVKVLSSTCGSVVVGSEEYRGVKNSSRREKEGLFIRAQGFVPWRFSGQKTRINLSLGAGGFPPCKGIKNPHMQPPKTNIKTSARRGLRSVAPPAAQPALTARPARPGAGSRPRPSPSRTRRRPHPRGLLSLFWLKTALGSIAISWTPFIIAVVTAETRRVHPRSQWWSEETCQH